MLSQNMTDKRLFEVEETPEIYSKFTRPHYIDQINPKTNQWIFDILEHKEEEEDIIFEDCDFILKIQDPAFKNLDFDNPENFWVFPFLVLTYDKSIKSIRDLNYKHLSMLKSIKKKSV